MTQRLITVQIVYLRIEYFLKTALTAIHVLLNLSSLNKQGSLVTVKSLCMYLIKFYLSTVFDSMYPINSFHEELKIKSLFLPKLLCLTIFSLCRGDLVNCTRNRLSLGSFCVLGFWDSIVCHTASVASVVIVWLLTGDVPKNMTSIALYVSRKKVMNYNF